jgi:hypothetical protein
VINDNSGKNFVDYHFYARKREREDVSRRVIETWMETWMETSCIVQQGA